MSDWKTADTRKMLIHVIERLERLDKLEHQIDYLVRRDISASIEEISLNRASKTLHLGPQILLQHVERGELKARQYKDNDGKIRYRFRLSDIVEFQAQGIEIAEKVFAKREENKKRKVDAAAMIRKMILESQAAN